MPYCGFTVDTGVDASALVLPKQTLGRVQVSNASHARCEYIIKEVLLIQLKKVAPIDSCKHCWTLQSDIWHRLQAERNGLIGLSGSTPRGGTNQKTTMTEQAQQRLRTIIGTTRKLVAARSATMMLNSNGPIGWKPIQTLVQFSCCHVAPGT